MKFTAIAASLLAAASADNGTVDEKERKLNEMIMELQLLKEGLTIRRVSVVLLILNSMLWFITSPSTRRMDESWFRRIISPVRMHHLRPCGVLLHRITRRK